MIVNIQQEERVPRSDLVCPDTHHRQRLVEGMRAREGEKVAPIENMVLQDDRPDGVLQVELIENRQ